MEKEQEVIPKKVFETVIATIHYHRGQENGTSTSRCYLRMLLRQGYLIKHVVTIDEYERNKTINYILEGYRYEYENNNHE